MLHCGSSNILFWKDLEKAILEAQKVIGLSIGIYD